MQLTNLFGDLAYLAVWCLADPLVLLGAAVIVAAVIDAVLTAVHSLR